MLNTQTLPETPVVFVPLEQIASTIKDIIHKQLREKDVEDLQEKLLSPKETCKLFIPSISLVTLDSWSDKGLLTKHHIGGRTYYKYSEVMSALKTIKKYSRKQLVHQ